MSKAGGSLLNTMEVELALFLYSGKDWHEGRNICGGLPDICSFQP